MAESCPSEEALQQVKLQADKYQVVLMKVIIIDLTCIKILFSRGILILAVNPTEKRIDGIHDNHFD